MGKGLGECEVLLREVQGGEVEVEKKPVNRRRRFPKPDEPRVERPMPATPETITLPPDFEIT
ncbi:MAG: hypothetical protein ACO39X_07045, partial [Candidatus Nanopelagicaceae bacterium]